ncbi:hypothetical protein DCS_04704 [Drechmeria coniospora]|uniref:Leo1-like protein n=1 Tax=Drechmeria coniospora TaxID=98403 RepID=A0A151GKX7_DRECN|nr:hypothetical protein DCS_04704 [Drechmeria coniospora]KYK57691.1 hypothetical protein DCS_04704 [Drechmeria coniospora]ODA79581.1 hypothetical protein RJ55_05175 [Drechmeria coniospora]
MSDSEDPLDIVDEGGDDLFGDEGDDDASLQGRVEAEEDDLASEADEEDDSRRRGYGDYETQETRDKVVIEQATFRHRIPKSKDGMLRILRVPNFIKFMPEIYVPDTFEPSEFDLANAKSDQAKHVARAQQDANTGELKSNTNIYRWSDGSVTIAVGGEHYEIQKKALAGPPNQAYNELHDGHYYAAAAELSSNMLITVGHLMEQYNVKPNKAVGDDALSLFAERMAQANKGTKGEEMIIRTTRDPELQKKQAELAEKERIKAQRRRENAAAKMDGGPLGRSGRGGLSIGDLEGRGVGSGRKRGAPGSAKPKRRRPEYDSDDDLPQGVGRHEDYDMDDGFLVGSDEEELESDADEDNDDEALDEEYSRGRRSKKQKNKESEEDEDAEGDDIEPAVESSRQRRRNVVDDDDD